MSEQNSNRAILIAHVAKLLAKFSASKACEYGAADRKSGEMEGDPVRAIKFTERGAQDIPGKLAPWKYLGRFYIDEANGRAIVYHKDTVLPLSGWMRTWQIDLDGTVKLLRAARS